MSPPRADSPQSRSRMWRAAEHQRVAEPLSQNSGQFVGPFVQIVVRPVLQQQLLQFRRRSVHRARARVGQDLVGGAVDEQQRAAWSQCRGRPRTMGLRRHRHARHDSRRQRRGLDDHLRPALRRATGAKFLSNSAGDDRHAAVKTWRSRPFGLDRRSDHRVARSHVNWIHGCRFLGGSSPNCDPPFPPIRSETPPPSVSPEAPPPPGWSASAVAWPRRPGRWQYKARLPAASTDPESPW